MSEQELLDKEKRRGEEAQRLLNNDLLKETLDAMESEAITLWEQTPARDVEGREHLHRFYIAVRKFRNTLLNFVSTGDMASLQIERSAKEKIVNFFRG